MIRGLGSDGEGGSCTTVPFAVDALKFNESDGEILFAGGMEEPGSFR